jgi:hypothetical protein
MATRQFRFWVEEDEHAPDWQRAPVLGPYPITTRGFDALSRDVERMFGTTAAEWAVSRAEVLAERSKTW